MREAEEVIGAEAEVVTAAEEALSAKEAAVLEEDFFAEAGATGIVAGDADVISMIKIITTKTITQWKISRHPRRLHAGEDKGRIV